jgi:two-component system sensor histidine kinase DesK
MRVQQRLRVARDVHDVVASSLSAVALKADLAGRLLTSDPLRARREVAEATALAHRTAAEARSLSGEYPDTSLVREITSAGSVLATAGVVADVRVTVGDLRAAVDLTLAVVLREAVANVLRHSAAARCLIAVWSDGRGVWLRVANDGVVPPAGGGPEVGAGTGIDNLRSRVGALDGRLTVGPDGAGGFVLVAELPAGPADAAVSTLPGQETE